jgi:phosphate transport system permease protein
VLHSWVVRYLVTGAGVRSDQAADKESDSFVRTGVPSVAAGRASAVPRKITARLSASDRAFHGVARAGGLVVLVLLGLVGTFLFYRASQALHKAGWSFLTTQAWNPNGGGFGIAAVIIGTILIALVAVVVAAPLSFGTAIFVSEYAPRSIQRFLISVVDLMAAVPSVVFGLWGAFLVQWHIVSVSRWIHDWFGWIPLFKVDGVTPHDPQPTATAYTSSTFIAGIVVALMITPIASSIMREAFSQAPPGEREGAYALGATRWGMIRAVVLPFGAGAMIGGIMLGLGRALGETIAVVMIISLVFSIQPHILQHGTSSISALIAAHYSEATPFEVSALMAAGLALFALTLLVNIIAAVIVSRSRSGAVSEA